MNKIYNILTILAVVFLLPVALAQFPFPFPGFSPNNAAPAQQGNYLQVSATYLSTIPDFIQRWLAKDNGSDARTNTADKYPNFVKLGTAADEPTSQAQKMITEYLGEKDIPEDVNNFTFTTLVGSPINGTDKNDASYNFLKTASGSLLTLSPPTGSPSPGLTQYKNVYKTLVSAISYNNYAITKIYNDMKRDGVGDDNVIKKLIKQSTDQEWLQNIGGEQNLGVIFRQMLLYLSQSYVLQARMVEMQRAANISQVVTNTLLVLSIQNGIRTLQNTQKSSTSTYQMGG